MNIQNVYKYKLPIAPVLCVLGTEQANRNEVAFQDVADRTLLERGARTNRERGHDGTGDNAVRYTRL